MRAVAFPRAGVSGDGAAGGAARPGVGSATGITTGRSPMIAATIPAAMEASTSGATAARVHASAPSPVSAAMLRQRWQGNQQDAEKGLEQGGLVHGTTPPVNQG